MNNTEGAKFEQKPLASNVRKFDVSGFMLLFYKSSDFTIAGLDNIQTSVQMTDIDAL